MKDNNEVSAIPTKKQEPEFLTLLNAMRQQISSVDDYSNTIYRKVSILKKDDKPILDQDNENIVDDSVMSELWELVDKLKRCNDTLSQTKFILQDLVG